VRKSFNSSFLIYVFKEPVRVSKTQTSIKRAILTKDIEKLKDAIYTFFAGIPHDWYRNNDIASYEGFYSSVVYALFNGAGLNIRVEDSTNVGRIDLSILSEDAVYILEFKVVEDKEEYKALKQIKEKRYYEKYKGKEVYLIGIEFSKEKKNIVSFEWEKV
ncbi:MAG: PD-(D/E)XK nuclease domain-containing protein, partial [Hydrogenobaculum sp.]